MISFMILKSFNIRVDVFSSVMVITPTNSSFPSTIMNDNSQTFSYLLPLIVDLKECVLFLHFQNDILTIFNGHCFGLIFI